MIQHERAVKFDFHTACSARSGRRSCSSWGCPAARGRRTRDIHLQHGPFFSVTPGSLWATGRLAAASSSAFDSAATPRNRGPVDVGTSRATVAARTAARTSALWPPPRASGPAAGPTCATRAVFRRAAPRASPAATLAPPLTNFGRASVARGGVETVALAGRAVERRKRASNGRGGLVKVSVKPVWVFYARTSPQLAPQRGRRS